MISQKHALLSASQFVTPLMNGRRVLNFSYKNWIVLIIVKIQLRSRYSEAAN